MIINYLEFIMLYFQNGDDSGSSDSESDDDAASETDDKTEQNVDKSSLAEENLSATENTDLDIRTWSLTIPIMQEIFMNHIKSEIKSAILSTKIDESCLTYIIVAIIIVLS